MLACVDVAYLEKFARVACVLFRDFEDAEPKSILVVKSELAAPYVPGELYRRELPPILDVLSRVHERLEMVVVDGYVWLGPHGPGLGARLYESLDRAVPVIGVAKTSWAESKDEDDPARCAIEVFRGNSKRPLFVTAVGVDVSLAASWISSMHGEHRLPTLLKRVDAASRGEP